MSSYLKRQYKLQLVCVVLLLTRVRVYPPMRGTTGTGASLRFTRSTHRGRRTISYKARCIPQLRGMLLCANTTSATHTLV